MTFLVFNPLSGAHTEAPDIESAQQLREQFKSDFIQHHIELFSIVEVVNTQYGEELVPV